MPAFTSGQSTFISQLAGATGLNPGVVGAWVASEENGSAAAQRQAANNHDWLNIGYTDTATLGAANNVWKNPVSAAKATAQWLKGQWSDPGFGTASSGIQAITRTAGQSPAAQIDAIQRSGWASSGYPNLDAVYNTYKSSVPGASSPSTPGTGAQPQTLPQAPSTTSPTTTTFDQAGYNAALAKSIAGNYLSGQTDPYAAGQPKVSTGSSGNPLLTSGLLTTAAPNPADYQTAQAALQKIAGPSTPLNQHPAAFQANLKGSGYTNPLPGATWERTDMGVDASMSNGAPIKAIGDSKVVNIYPNWYRGQPYVLFQFLNGPQAGKYYYVAEAINPTVKPGDTVRAGQTIGTYNSGGTGLELGWGTSGSQTQAQASGNTGDSTHANSPAGIAFHNFLAGIGAFK